MTYKSGTLNPTQSINQRKSTRYHGQLKKGCRTAQRSIGKLLISLAQAIKLLGGYIKDSITTHGPCHAEPMVTFLSKKQRYHRHLAGTHSPSC